MNLVEWNKAERRKRVLAAARRMIDEFGLERLTMRALAEASHVSVPTVYNLVGGKDVLVFALAGEILEEVLAKSSPETLDSQRSTVARAFALCETGISVLLAAPHVSRQLLHHLLVSKDYEEPIRAIHRQNIELVTNVVRDGQRTDEIVDWIDPQTIAVAAHDAYIAAITRWAIGESDAEALRADAQLGIALVLLGVVTTDARRHEVEVIAKQAADAAAQSTHSESPATKRANP